MKQSDLENTYFVPMAHMRKTIATLNDYKKTYKYCGYNLYRLQQSREVQLSYSMFAKTNWKRMFFFSCRKALYSHDWDKLLYLLRKFPIWKFYLYESSRPNHYRQYYRYLTLVLMYNPSCQAYGLLNEFLHMTLGCRSDTDKMAILKVLLHLPKRLPVWRAMSDKKEEMKEELLDEDSS